MFKKCCTNITQNKSHRLKSQQQQQQQLGEFWFVTKLCGLYNKMIGVCKRKRSKNEWSGLIIRDNQNTQKAFQSGSNPPPHPLLHRSQKLESIRPSAHTPTRILPPPPTAVVCSTADLAYNFSSRGQTMERSNWDQPKKLLPQQTSNTLQHY